MFKLIAVAVAAIFGTMQMFGAEERRVEVEVAQQITDDAAGFTLASMDVEQLTSSALPAHNFGVSDAEAVQIAMKAGADIRGDRTYSPLYGVVAAVDAAGIAAASGDTTPTQQEEDADMWYVTGSSVNLRAGPGTSNAVVGRLGFGTQAEVLSSESGWYEIRTSDGTTSGWIFGKFLADSLPS